MRIAASHRERDALKLMLRELPQAGTSMAPGFATLVGGRPQPLPMVKLFSFLIDKREVAAELDLDGERSASAASSVATGALVVEGPADAAYPPIDSACTLALYVLAHGRSGDKGNSSNIGILARQARFVPLIGAALTEQAVARHLAHLLDPSSGRVRRYALPGCHGWNFLLENSLGGGGIASLRADPQGKAHAQQLLAFPVPVPKALYDELTAR